MDESYTREQIDFCQRASNCQQIKREQERRNHHQGDCRIRATFDLAGSDDDSGEAEEERDNDIARRPLFIDDP